jgi:putative hemolysin
VDVTLLSELALFVVLMGLSGFFSSSETSLFSLSKLQIEQMRRDDNPHAPLIARLLSEPRRLIVTILIGNEFVNVAASVISAAIVIRVLGAENKLVNLFIMVPILLLIGEITPKTLAIRNNQAFASFQSGPIALFARVIAPIRWLVRHVADFFTTLIVGKERTRASIVTEDMVRTLAHEAVGEGVLDHHEARYIDQIFEFGSRTVADLMTRRSDVFFLPADMPFPEILAELRRTRHTKVPVYREHRDEILGVLHVRDLLGKDLSALEERPDRLQKLLREPYFVPESKPASKLFYAFKKRKLSVALTVDEFGGVTGLVTMEDLLECIFGDIPSASEVAKAVAPETLPDGRLRLDASISIEQFNQALGTDLPAGSVQTLGGLVLSEVGELPEKGTSLDIGGMEIRVETIEGARVKTVTVSRPEPPSPTPEAGGPDAEEPG